MGTPPITFTFYKGNDTKKIVTNDTYATFLDENIRQNDKRPYKCGAKNNHSSGMKTSNILNITVIGKFILLVAHISIFETVAANGGLSKMDVKCLQIFVTWIKNIWGCVSQFVTKLKILIVIWIKLTTIKFILMLKSDLLREAKREAV